MEFYTFMIGACHEPTAPLDDREVLPRYAHELLLDELAATDKRLAAARQTIAELSAENRALRFALRQIGRGCRTEREGAPPHESDEIL